MDYSLKANLYLQGVALTPCNDCPFRGEKPVVPIWAKTQRCFKRCPHPIMIWILNKQQLKLYEKVRPPELKERDANKAIKEERIIIIKIIQIKEIQMKITITREGKVCDVKERTLRESQESLPLPVFNYEKHI